MDYSNYADCGYGDEICAMKYLNGWTECIDGCNDSDVERVGDEYCEKECVRKAYKDIVKCVSMLPEADFPTFAECMFRAILETGPCYQMCPAVPQ